MLAHFFNSPHVIQRLRRGPAGQYLEGFAEQLCRNGYAQLTARRYIRAVSHLIRWINRKRLDTRSLTESQVEKFQRHLPLCRCGPYGRSDRSSLLNGPRHFLKYLERLGAITAAVDSKPTGPFLWNGFCQWMQRHRGVCGATVHNYRGTIRELLETLGENPNRFDAQALRKFILERNQHCGRAKVKTSLTALRMFIRYLTAEGKVAPGLEAAIPAIAEWRLSTLPRYLAPEEVERVIDACDISTKVGIRDRVIVLLLARLALRAGDVATLRLGDMNWRDAWISVSGKSRRQTRFPLSQEIGDSILTYLEKVRPRVNTDALFIQVRAPLKTLSSKAVSAIVARAMRRAGVRPAGRGSAHALRHSAATTMLRRGASLYEIAAVLRHRSIETTAIYAKVDIVSLRQIAQPWPGVSPC